MVKAFLVRGVNEAFIPGSIVQGEVDFVYKRFVNCRLVVGGLADPEYFFDAEKARTKIYAVRAASLEEIDDA